MHNFTKKLLRFVLFVSLATSTASSRSDETSFDSEQTRWLTELTKGESSGVAALVARDGKIVFQAGFGLADLEKKTPVTAETRFRIGSVTKQFTAAAILRLAEQGKLSLDDPLPKHFPGFADHGGVTVRHLLTHTSGLHSYTEKPEFLTRVTKPIEPDELIAWFQNDKIDFAPGEGFHYNNSAYFLLGQLVSKVSGRSYGEYLGENFFEPLGMKNTGVYVNSNPPAGMATGYSFADEKLQPAVDWDMSWAGGAGALYSTVGDLFLWNEALYGGRILSPASFQAAITPVERSKNADGMKYGYGLFLSDLKRLPAIGHGGGLNGWWSDLLRLPDQKVTVVVLCNALPGPPKLTPHIISRRLAEKLVADEIQKLPPFVEDRTVDPKTFPEFAGRYLQQGVILTFAVEEDGLFVFGNGLPKARLFPKGMDEFFFKDGDSELKFVRDDMGKVIAVRHVQGGVRLTATRLAEDAVKLTVEAVELIVGKYQYGATAVLTVSRDGTQLFAQLTGQPKFPIFPTAENEFEWRVVPAKVQFVKDADGKVTKAVHHQDGNVFDAPKVK